MPKTTTSTEMVPISLRKAVSLLTELKEQGKPEFFRVKAIKRTNGEDRWFLAAFDIKCFLKGGEAAYDFDAKALMCVCDVLIARRIRAAEKAGIPKESRHPDLRSAYRSVNLLNILELKIRGVHYKVVRN